MSQRTDSAIPRSLFAMLGLVPIGSLCIALFGLVPLHVSAKFLVLPAAAAAVGLGLLFPRWGRLALVGFAAGVVATGAYDVTRLGLVWLGVWPDFIPPIGRLALEDQATHPFWGYLWRFVGNGGGMAVSFAMLPWRGVRSGMAYGAAICVCLYLTLWLAPGAQERLFTLTWVTAAAAMLGHLDYGGVLGWLLKRWEPTAVTRSVGMTRAEGVGSART